MAVASSSWPAAWARASARARSARLIEPASFRVRRRRVFRLSDLMLRIFTCPDRQLHRFGAVRRFGSSVVASTQARRLRASTDRV